MISFRAIRDLPLLLPEPSHISDNECVETDIYGAHIIVTHHYMPIYGAVIHASISGSEAGKEILVEGFSAEFGIVLSSHRDDNGTWHYQWPSELEAIPKTSVQEVVGDNKIDEICQKHELSDEDKRLLLDLIVQFYLLMGKYDERTAYMTEITAHMTEGQRENLIVAMLKVMIEFVEKQFKKTNNPG